MNDAAGTTRKLRLASPVIELPGVGKRRALVLARMGISSISDLLRHLPMRYELQHAEGEISAMPASGIASVRGTVVGARFVPSFSRKAKSRFEAVITDAHRQLMLVWFNAGYLRDKIHPGQIIRVQGQVKSFNGYPQIINPKWEPLPDLETMPARDETLAPVYPATEEIPSARMAALVGEALKLTMDQLVDPLSPEYLKERAMPALAQAYRMVHQPEHADDPPAGRRRLAYNELLILQLGIEMKREHSRTKLKAPALRWSDAIDRHIRQRLPFELTQSQSHVTKQIAGDLQLEQPMNRLLQGDVGAGKTAVALYALLMAVADRKQGALMAPTELLAQQHFQSIERMLQGSGVKLALLSSGQGASGSAARKALLGQIARGEIDIIVGTQALLGEHVQFHDLALVVVDEQHRFGVMQRAAFRGKLEANASNQHDENARIASPHYLVMTATPIPRTLSLTVFGDLDVSTITGLPPGRTPIITRVVGPEKTDDVYQYVAQKVAQGQQAYVVVPIIDETGSEQATQLKNVLAHQKLLQDKFFGSHRVEAIHGRLKAETRDAIMNRFRKNETQVLVATTVIEVGVDVPNATMMVIEHAERFGLAQLHQLRGRVGRGDHGYKSVCVLIGEPATEDSAKRLEAIAKTTDGFKIAEADLEIRGMGDFFGTRQHGSTPLRVARIPDDIDLIQMARRDAQAIINEDPALNQDAHVTLRKIMLAQYGQWLGLVDVG